jgi:BMFP domain-containing protein YqiC
MTTRDYSVISLRSRFPNTLEGREELNCMQQIRKELERKIKTSWTVWLNRMDAPRTR